MRGELRLQPWPEEWTLEEDSIPLLTAAATLPLWEGRGGGRFNRYYRACSRAFLGYCRTMLAPLAQARYRQALETACPLPQWRVELRTDVAWQSGGVLSLRIDTVEQCDGRRLVLRRGDTWDLRTGLPLPLSAHFPPGSHWRRQLLELAQEQTPPERRALLRRHFSPARYYLTEQGLCFFYQMYDLSPAICEFTVPYNEERGPLRPV